MAMMGKLQIWSLLPLLSYVTELPVAEILVTYCIESLQIWSRSGYSVTQNTDTNLKRIIVALSIDKAR